MTACQPGVLTLAQCEALLRPPDLNHINQMADRARRTIKPYKAELVIGEDRDDDQRRHDAWHNDWHDDMDENPQSGSGAAYI